MGSWADWGDKGPLFFVASSSECPGQQAGIALRCAITGGKTCANGSSDNCFSRTARSRIWNAHPVFSGSPGVIGSGIEKKIPSGQYIQYTPTFNIGGKAFAIQVKNDLSGARNIIHVELLNGTSLAYSNFPTQAVDARAYSEKQFISRTMVSVPCDTIRIVNDGPGTVWIQQVESID